MYTMRAYSNKSVFHNYMEWRKQPEHECVHEIVDRLYQAALKEVYQYEDIGENVSEEDLIDRMEQLAHYSTELDCRFLMNGVCMVDEALNCRYLNGSTCLNSTLFSMLFCGSDSSLLIEPKYIHEYDWRSLEPLLGHTDLKHVQLLVDGLTEDFMPEDMGGTPKGFHCAIVGRIWEPVQDRFYVITRCLTRSYEEIEDGYPIDIDVFTQEYHLVTESEGMKKVKERLLSAPRPSQEELSEGFWKERNKCIRIKEQDEKKRAHDAYVKATVESLQQKIKDSISNGEWEKAAGYCEQVLKMESCNGTLYYFALLAEHKTAEEDKLMDSANLCEDKNFKMARKYGDAQLRARLDQIEKSIQRREKEKGEKAKKIVRDSYEYCEKVISNKQSSLQELERALHVLEILEIEGGEVLMKKARGRIRIGNAFFRTIRIVLLIVFGILIGRGL